MPTNGGIAIPGSLAGPTFQGNIPAGEASYAANRVPDTQAPDSGRIDRAI
jgi:hypothetical protein